MEEGGGRRKEEGGGRRTFALLKGAEHAEAAKRRNPSLKLLQPIRQGAERKEKRKEEEEEEEVEIKRRYLLGTTTR